MTPEPVRPQTSARTRRFTPLEIFGAVLAFLYLLDGLALFYTQMIGTGPLFFYWLFYGLPAALVLILIWVGFVITWRIRRQSFSKQLLVVPLITIVVIVLAWFWIPQKVVWHLYQEPRMTEFAQEVLADPRSALRDTNDQEVAHIGIGSVGKIPIDDGKSEQVDIIISGLDLTGRTELIYRPDGKKPTYTMIYGQRYMLRGVYSLSENWWCGSAPDK